MAGGSVLWRTLTERQRDRQTWRSFLENVTGTKITRSQAHDLSPVKPQVPQRGRGAWFFLRQSSQTP